MIPLFQSPGTLLDYPLIEQLKCSVQSFYQVCCFGYCFSQRVLQGEKGKGRQSVGMPRQKKVTRPIKPM